MKSSSIMRFLLFLMATVVKELKSFFFFAYNQKVNFSMLQFLKLLVMFMTLEVVTYYKHTGICILFQVLGTVLRRLHLHSILQCYDMVALNVLNTSHVETTFRLTLPIYMVMHEDLLPALSVAN